MSTNTYPGGVRHAMEQADHEKWNASNFPGTRQLCCKCEQPTGRCEDDAIMHQEQGPFCEDCAPEEDPESQCCGMPPLGEIFNDFAICSGCKEQADFSPQEE